MGGVQVYSHSKGEETGMAAKIDEFLLGFFSVFFSSSFIKISIVLLGVFSVWVYLVIKWL